VDLATRRLAALRLELLLVTTAVKKGMSLGTALMKGNQRLVTIVTKKDISLVIVPTLLQPVVVVAVAVPNATNVDKWVILQGHALRIMIRDGAAAAAVVVVVIIVTLFATLVEETVI